MCLCKPEIRTPWCDDCQTFAYKRIKDLESTTLELQSELARKKMSLSVACNRVEELENKLKVAVDALKSHLAIWQDDHLEEALKQLGELE